MRLVVADTGPLRYLALIGAIEVFRLFETVVAPEAVLAELLHPSAPAEARHWAGSSPGWFRTMPAPAIEETALLALDIGERDAIALALSIQADLVLLDDRAGVAAARARGLEVTGTLGVLDRAARRGLIDLGVTLAALETTNFHVRRELFDLLLSRDRERRGKS